ncbi:uncharacterized protein ARMOST_18577 [Armillaria ostoyae]|uniref:Uncharacterized protein n=1 Tax=Armillaria ostoyae TaxID=47428 RepID=A0A284S275_ARMOS|nr:uncharacterized protein ARMOST_18577 [Armillaria ostoyae]
MQKNPLYRHRNGTKNVCHDDVHNFCCSGNGHTRSTRAGDVAARVSLTGSATEDIARSLGADKAGEEIAAEEVPPKEKRF